jgi:uncharacterized protein
MVDRTHDASSFVDATGAEAAAVEQPPPASGMVARFCPRCGSAVSEAWPACARCERLATLRQRAAEPVGLDRRSLWSSVGLYLALLATSAGGLVFGAAISMFDESSDAELLIMWSVQAIDTAIVLVWAAFSWRILTPVLATIGRWWWYPGAVLGGGFTFVFATLLLGAALRILELEEPALIDSISNVGWGVAVLSVAVQPAVIEELAFRGIMLTALRRIMSAWQAIAVSAALFMTLHLSPLALPHLLTLGFALGAMRIASGSMYPGMVLHFTHNFLCLVTEGHPLFGIRE